MMEQPWIGSRYAEPENRLLILGESWYGDEIPLTRYVPEWCSKVVTDALFSRLFNACSGYRTERASIDQRLGWWQQIAFCNFVPGTVGTSRSNRPTSSQFQAGEARLGQLLSQLKPRGVWILGKEQSEYSAPVAKELRINVQVSPHPASYGVRTATLAAAWSELQRQVEGGLVDT